MDWTGIQFELYILFSSKLTISKFFIFVYYISIHFKHWRMANLSNINSSIFIPCFLMTQCFYFFPYWISNFIIFLKLYLFIQYSNDLMQQNFCFLLSTWLLKRILLAFTVYVSCRSLLNLCCDFSIILFLLKMFLWYPSCLSSS